jgi:parvulin-like peptidyl-prolyl isomerase
MLLKKCLPLFLCLPPLMAQGPLARDPKTVVAVADGKNITWGEIQEMMLTAPPDIVAGLQTNPKSALMNLLLFQHLGKEGLERHLDQESPTKEQIELMRLQILSNARLNQEFNSYQPTPEMIQKYYDGHLNQYQRVRATGVLIKFRPESKAGATSAQDLAAMAQQILQSGSVQRTEAEALKIANDVAKQWRDGGDIEALAAKYSEDEPSKPLGGDLGFISVKSRHAEELRNAAISMVPKTISDPIRLPAGFYVVRVEERSPVPLKDVQLEIAQAVRNEHFEEWMSGLNRRFAVEIKDPTIIVQPMKPGAQPAKPAPGK